MQCCLTHGTHSKRQLASLGFTKFPVDQQILYMTLERSLKSTRLVNVSFSFFLESDVTKFNQHIAMIGCCIFQMTLLGKLILVRHIRE